MFSLKKEIATHRNTSFRLEYFIRNFACSSWCIHQCQGCRTNKRSVYANPSTYIFCLHMRGLFDLTGWHASALRIGFMACSLPGNRPYSTTILLGHARFSTDTNDFSRNSPRPEGKKSKGSATLLCRLHCPTYPCMRRDSVKRLAVVLSEFLHFTFLEKEIYVHLILLSEEKINFRFF